MTDLFEEVEEQLRVEKYKSVLKKALPWILGLVFGVVVIGGGYVGYKTWSDARASKASQAFEAALKTAGSGDMETAYKEFGAIAKKAPGGYKALALMHQAGIRLQDDKAKEAAALFDAAAKAAPAGKAGQILGDSARLKSALALLDDAPYADIEARLKPLTENDRPYRILAREALAMAKLNAGKAKEARDDFLVLSTALDGPPGVAQRAQAAVRLIDSGAAGGIPAAVKAAKALPPPSAMQLPPEILQQLQAQGVQLPGPPAQ